ncbi:hypothetical protein LOAG_14483, partial [Loa loa]
DIKFARSVELSNCRFSALNRCRGSPLLWFTVVVVHRCRGSVSGYVCCLESLRELPDCD